MTFWNQLMRRVGYGEERGAAGKGLLLWLVGVPLPVILVLWVLGFLN